jgi:hypothetical protein
MSVGPIRVPRFEISREISLQAGKRQCAVEMAHLPHQVAF